ncbi:hypothetical protein SLA2020_068260 [Shorea laevis]
MCPTPPITLLTLSSSKKSSAHPLPPCPLQLLQFLRFPLHCSGRAPQRTSPPMDKGRLSSTKTHLCCSASTDTHTSSLSTWKPLKSQFTTLVTFLSVVIPP